MISALKVSWALFLGLGLIMVGNGLGGSLVGIRTQVEDFGNTLTGFVVAGYFAGFFLGSAIVPKMLAKVGHVRVFAALAALASMTILVYPLIIDPYVWILMRILTGLAYAGLYIVVESWLNEKATNDTRGQILAIYLVVSMLGLASGQLILNLYDPANFQLFTIVSVMISVAALPVLISGARAPEFTAPESLGPIKLFKISSGFSRTVSFQLSKNKARVKVGSAFLISTYSGVGQVNESDDVCYNRQLFEIAYFFGFQMVSLKTPVFPSQD